MSNKNPFFDTRGWVIGEEGLVYEGLWEEDEPWPYELDDERIMRGEVSDEEKRGLERRLLGMYSRKAEAAGKDIVIMTNAKEYEQLRVSGELFERNKYFLLMNENKTELLDMTPVAYHLLRTPEGRFYAKLMPLDECHQP